MPTLTVTVPKSTLLIVDSESLVHRAYHAFTDSQDPLRTTSGLLSGAFYGFFNMLQTQIELYAPETILFSWGDKRSNLLRRKIYPEYKGNRPEESKIGLQEQIFDIKLSLGSMGFLQYWSPGYEADDVIAELAKKYSSQFQSFGSKSKIVILSADKDMLQLVDARITVATFSNNNFTEYDTDKVLNKFGVTPDYLSDYFSLIGDNSDNVPGVEGIGPKIAYKLLNDNGKIQVWFNNIPNINATDSVKQKLINNRETLVLSKKLISLKLHSTPLQKLDFNTIASPDFIFDKYEMKKLRPHNFLFTEKGELI
jgi:DNA polymerase-1